MKIGTQLLIARRDMNNGKGITQGAVEEATGVQQATISNIEKNKSDPKLSTVLKLSTFYQYKLRIVK